MILDIWLWTTTQTVAQFQTNPFRSSFRFRLIFQELIKNISSSYLFIILVYVFWGLLDTFFTSRGDTIDKHMEQNKENMVHTSKIKNSLSPGLSLNGLMQSNFTNFTWVSTHSHGWPLCWASPPVHPQFSPPAPHTKH